MNRNQTSILFSIALLTTVVASPAAARIECRDNFQVTKHGLISTPYCEERQIARIAFGLAPEHYLGRCLHDAAGGSWPRSLRGNARDHGTVLVVASQAEEASETLSFLTSFFADQPMLAGLFKKRAGDTLRLTNGVSITVTSHTTRRPPRLLATVTLDNTASIDLSDVTPRQYARAILGLVADDTGGRITAEIAAALDVDDQYFSQMFSRGEAKAEQDRLEWEARRAGQIARLTGAMRSAL